MVCAELVHNVDTRPRKRPSCEGTLDGALFMDVTRQLPYDRDMKQNTHGFTVVELLIVIVVIGILAAITVVAYNGIQQRARDSQRISAARALQSALAMYFVDHGSYPNVCFAEDGTALNN